MFDFSTEEGRRNFAAAFARQQIELAREKARQQMARLVRAKTRGDFPPGSFHSNFAEVEVKIHLDLREVESLYSKYL